MYLLWSTVVLVEVPSGGYRFPDSTASLVAALAWDKEASFFARREERSIPLKSRVFVFDPADDIRFFVATRS